jgi:hypothetical protein
MDLIYLDGLPVSSCMFLIYLVRQMPGAMLNTSLNHAVFGEGTST